MNKRQTFIGIMAFYALLTYVIFPLIFYYLGKKKLINAGYGFITGSIASIALWLTVGNKMI
jgi:uncharacterized membrane protein (DUF485 family)